MGAFLDRLNDMVVTTMSPHRVAEARFNRKSGLTIEWGPRGFSRLTAEQVSGEISKAVVAVLKGAGRGTERVREVVRGKPAATAPQPDPELAERRRLASERIHNLKVTGADAERYVIVYWKGATDVEVRVSPGALTRLESAALRDAVNEALASACDKYGREAAKVYADVYRFDELSEKWRRSR